MADLDVPVSVRVAVWFRRATLVAYVSAVVWVIMAGFYWSLLGVPFVVGVNVFGEIMLRRELDGLRRTAGDRDDPGTEAGTDADASTAGAGQATSLGIYVPSLTTVSMQQWAHAQFGGYLVPSQAVPMMLMSVGSPASVTPGMLPEREDDTPILAYKTACINWTRGPDGFGPRLVSAFTSRPYESSDRAECYGLIDGVTATHAAPAEACTCGFYAVRDPNELAASPVLIEVELFGRVIVYERGYRAERQRLLRVGLPGCFYCHGPSSVAAGKAIAPWETPEEHERSIYTMCEEHLPLCGPALTITFAELSERLGVPVGYDPSRPVQP